MILFFLSIVYTVFILQYLYYYIFSYSKVEKNFIYNSTINILFALPHICPFIYSFSHLSILTYAFQSINRHQCITLPPKYFSMLEFNTKCTHLRYTFAEF